MDQNASLFQNRRRASVDGGNKPAKLNDVKRAPYPTASGKREAPR